MEVCRNVVEQSLEASNALKDRDEPSNFSWIVPGELAAMGCPTSRDQLKTLAYRGISHLISLSEECVPPGIEQYTPLNWILVPVEEFHPPTMRQVVRFIEFCVNCRQKGEAVGVHCRMGRGRTGVMAACYLVYFLNVTPERAISTLRLTRPGSIETYKQERTIYEFRDLSRLENYDQIVLSLLEEPNEQVLLLQLEEQREKKKKAHSNYFQTEEIKKNMKVLEYNTLYIFLEILRNYVPFNPDVSQRRMTAVK
uniref:Dual specificity protein phosphatase 23 n=3 Tax=Cacopsylla melanoneura TaxID=428564 RepID=A0A8D9BSE0_9HEMI